MQTKFWVLSTFVAGTLLSLCHDSAYAKLTPPHDTAPFTINALGNAAMRNSGGFFKIPDRGFSSLVVWLGTETTPGSLAMHFSNPFLDGPGFDFAIRTSAEAWGPLAGNASFEFYNNGTLKGAFNSTLHADRLFEFELPGDGIIANRIVVTNITPDPPGINDDATMAFIDAGVAHTIPAPAALLLCAFGAATLKICKKHILEY